MVEKSFWLGLLISFFKLFFPSGVRIFEDVSDSQVSISVSLCFFLWDKNYYVSSHTTLKMVVV